MERSATPWRVLDADVDSATDEPGPSRRASAEGHPPRRSWPVIGSLAAAALLGVAAVVLVVSGPSPVAIAQADAAPVVAGSGGSVDPGGSADPGTIGDRIVVVAGAVRRRAS
jgi:hypothetical protein